MKGSWSAHTVMLQPAASFSRSCVECISSKLLFLLTVFSHNFQVCKKKITVA